jgi:hypothetical protein
MASATQAAGNLDSKGVASAPPEPTNPHREPDQSRIAGRRVVVNLLIRVAVCESRQLLRNRRFLSNLAKPVEKAPVPSIILNHDVSDTLITLNPYRRFR